MKHLDIILEIVDQVYLNDVQIRRPREQQLILHVFLYLPDGNIGRKPLDDKTIISCIQFPLLHTPHPIFHLYLQVGDKDNIQQDSHEEDYGLDLHGIYLSHAHDVYNRTSADRVEKAIRSAIDNGTLGAHHEIDQHCW
jgi:hypothetical protein